MFHVDNRETNLGTVNTNMQKSRQKHIHLLLDSSVYKTHVAQLYHTLLLCTGTVFFFVFYYLYETIFFKNPTSLEFGHIIVTVSARCGFNILVLVVSQDSI